MNLLHDIRALTATGIRPWLRRRAWFQRFKQKQEEADYFARLARYCPLTVGTETQPMRPETPSVACGRPLRTIFIAPRIAWHATLHRNLVRLGSSEWIDFEGLFYYEKAMVASKWVGQREELNRRIVEKCRQAIDQGTVDWVLVYSEGCHILRKTLQILRQELKLKVVVMCLDDKQHWDGQQVGGQHIYQLDLVSECDLYWTSARVCAEWVRQEGGRAIYLPEGCDPDEFFPMPVKKDIDISFVGARMGFREAWLRDLTGKGVPVSIFGKDWPNGPVPGGGLNEYFNRSRINLGHGGVNYSPRMYNMKGRDFEVPCSGNVYLTTYSPSLAECYVDGREILFYRDVDDLYETVLKLRSAPELLAQIGSAARERSLREHTWVHRFCALNAELMT